MAHASIDKWFGSGKYAKLNGSRVRPIPHPVLDEEPLPIQKGQAVAICLIADDGGRLVLKKFHQGRSLDRSYLVSVTSLLPCKDGFVAGTQRQILSSDKLGRTRGCYYAADLAAFLDATILMPLVTGTDWAGLADEIRQGQVKLSKPHRVALCRNLVELVVSLEDVGCAHRDFSNGNVFIDITSCRIYLIDFDSLYHPSLPMPKATTCGTVGYVPPFAWRGDTLDACRTWCPHADRYALGLLIAEFCILDKGSPITADGGMFDQNELCRRRGPGLDSARKALLAYWPNLSDLFEATIGSRDFESCPSPQDWQHVLDSTFPKPPSLDQLGGIPAGYFERISMSSNRPAIPLLLPPDLSEIPRFKVEPRKGVSNAVTLPSNPWN